MCMFLINSCKLLYYLCPSIFKMQCTIIMFELFDQPNPNVKYKGLCFIDQQSYNYCLEWCFYQDDFERNSIVTIFLAGTDRDSVSIEFLNQFGSKQILKNHVDIISLICFILLKGNDKLNIDHFFFFLRMACTA